METNLIDSESTGGGGRVKGEGTTKGNLTTEQMAGMQWLPNQEDSADRATDRIESNTLGVTSDTGAGHNSEQ